MTLIGQLLSQGYLTKMSNRPSISQWWLDLAHQSDAWPRQGGPEDVQPPLTTGMLAHGVRPLHEQQHVTPSDPQSLHSMISTAPAVAPHEVQLMLIDERLLKMIPPLVDYLDYCHLLSYHYGCHLPMFFLKELGDDPLHPFVLCPSFYHTPCMMVGLRSLTTTIRPTTYT